MKTFVKNLIGPEASNGGGKHLGQEKFNWTGGLQGTPGGGLAENIWGGKDLIGGNYWGRNINWWKSFVGPGQPDQTSIGGPLGGCGVCRLGGGGG